MFQTTDYHRVFWALWPDVASREFIVDTQENWLIDDSRPLHPADLHMTLHFLAKVPNHLLHPLSQVVDDLSIEKFELDLFEIGVWLKPKVLWLAPRKLPQALLKLHRQLAEHIQELGLSVDNRSYRPHITLARGVRTEVSGYLPATLKWRPDKLVLAESTFAKAPPLFTHLATRTF